MGPGNTWFAFGYPPPFQPIEMLLFDHDSSSPSATSCSPPPLPPPPPPPPPVNDYFHHPISYACHLLPPFPAAPVKFEDFLPPPPPADQDGAPVFSTSLLGPAPRELLQVAPASEGGGGCGSDSAEAYSSPGCNVAFAASGRSTPDSRNEIPISVRPLAVVAGTPDRDGNGDMTVAAPAAAGAVRRTSVYRGVTRHRWTGRYEAHLWDNTCRREGQKRKGRQVYLGGYEKEEKAARAYDLAALKYWGSSATTNFPISTYEKEIEGMKCMTKQEFIASIRRNSSGFSRGASIYRGVTRHHQHGKWQARIGRVAGNKDLYLGTFATEEEAAEAYDVAAIKFRGLSAVTNFELSRYDIEAITNTDLPIGSSGKRIKQSVEVEDSQLAIVTHDPLHMNIVPNSFLQNLLQLGSPIHDHCSLEDADQDICSQNLFLLSGSDQPKESLNPRSEETGILQLIDFSPTQ